MSISVSYVGLDVNVSTIEIISLSVFLLITDITNFSLRYTEVV